MPGGIAVLKTRLRRHIGRQATTGRTTAHTTAAVTADNTPAGMVSFGCRHCPRNCVSNSGGV